MHRKDIMDHMKDAASRSVEPIINQPILEICGGDRVLIEHHEGMMEYSSKSISVKVRYGGICVAGSRLEVCKMTADQLVITGDIETVTLLKGRRK